MRLYLHARSTARRKISFLLNFNSIREFAIHADTYDIPVHRVETRRDEKSTRVSPPGLARERSFWCAGTRSITAKNKQAERNTTSVIATTDRMFLLQLQIVHLYVRIARPITPLISHDEARLENCSGIKLYIPCKIRGGCCAASLALRPIRL